MGRLVDHLGKDHHTTWWFYDIRCDFFSVRRCSHTRLWALFGDFLGSLNMGRVLGGLHDHGFTRWMCFDSTSTLIGYGCAMYASKVGPPRKPQKQPKSPHVEIARGPGIFQRGFPRFRFWNYCSGHTGPSFSPFQAHSTFWSGLDFWFFQGHWATKTCAPLGFWRFLAHVSGKSPAASR